MDVVGSISCHQCPAGYQCADASNSPIPCISGQYSLAGSTSCHVGFFNHRGILVSVIIILYSHVTRATTAPLTDRLSQNHVLLDGIPIIYHRLTARFVLLGSRVPSLRHCQLHATRVAMQHQDPSLVAFVQRDIGLSCGYSLPKS